MQKLKRTNYVAFIWRNARLAQAVSFGPGGHGWEVHANNHVEPIWFEGSQSPVNISVEAVEDIGDSENKDEDNMSTYNMSSDEEENYEEQ